MPKTMNEICLQRISNRIYYAPHEQRRDRPLLGYIHGKNYSVMVDAGASAAHLGAVYAALAQAGLPRPAYTVITHWHWDHSFGMCAVSGSTIAHRNTLPKLVEMRESADPFAFGDARMRNEYGNGAEIRIVLPDILFEGSLILPMGDIHGQISKIPSPHSEDGVAVWIPEEKLLFLGDATSPDYFNGGTYEARALHELIAWLESCDFETCLLGHSEPLAKDALMAYLHSLTEQLP